MEKIVKDGNVVKEFVKVLPSIYRVKCEDLFPPGGWHELTELLEVVNNLFREQQLPEITKKELIDRFFHLKSWLPFTWFDGMYIRHGQRKHIREEMDFENQWLCVSAGWGVAVVEAVKRGVTRVGLYIRQGKYTIIGLNRLNTEIKVTDLVKGKKYLPVDFGKKKQTA